MTELHRSANTAHGIVSWGRLSDGDWRMEELYVRSPGDGELLVEMVATGVCHTDVLIGNLPLAVSPVSFYPRVLGHEGKRHSVCYEKYLH
jgi:Zn-dependent alcohol dehydrogenase